MIDPKHDCWWTQNRETKIGFNGSSFWGSGVSLPVLFSSLSRMPLVWLYTGDDDCQIDSEDEFGIENFYVLGMKEEDVGIGTENSQFGYLSRVSASKFPIMEMRWSGELQKKLNVKSFQSAFADEKGIGVVRLYIHDNCFYSVHPVRPEALVDWIGAILELHSFYLGCEIRTEELCDRIVTIMRSRPEIRLQSDPAHKILRIKWAEPSNSILGRLFGKTTMRQQVIWCGS